MCTNGTSTGEQDVDHLGSFLSHIEQEDRFNELLLKVRKGSPAVRKVVVKDLSCTPHPTQLIDNVLDILNEQAMDWYEKERLFKLVCRVLQQHPQLSNSPPFLDCSTKLLACVKELLMNHETSVSAYGELLLAHLLRLIGLKTFVIILRNTFEQSAQMGANAKILACSSRTFGLPLLIPLIKTLVREKSRLICQLGLVTIQRLPVYLDQSILLPFASQLVSLCSGPLTEPLLCNFANSALVYLADALSPLGFEAFEPILGFLWNGVRRRKGKPMISFLRTLAALVPLSPRENSSEIYTPVLEIAVPLFKSTELEERRSALNIVRRCVKFLDYDKANMILKEVSSNFWTVEATLDKRTSYLTLMTTLELPVNQVDLIKQLVDLNLLVSNSIHLQRLALEILARLSLGEIILDKRRELRLIDGVIASLPDPNTVDANEDKEELVEVGEMNNDLDFFESSSSSNISVLAFTNVVKSLPKDSLEINARSLITTLLERNSSPSLTVRLNSVKILSGISDILDHQLLIVMLRRLYEELGEQYPEVLAEVILAINSTFIALELSDYSSLDPSVAQVLTRSSSALRNRNEKVQEACITLIKTLADVAGEEVSAREWMHICFEVLELQKSPRQTTRFMATAAFASISKVIGPADVVTTLINHLRSPDRQFRVTTAAAIASVAAETGPFAALPILCNEYSSLDTVIQHGVLKTLAFMFEFLEPSKAVPYIESLVTLLDDAILSSNQVHRQTAASIVHHMSKASIGESKEPIFQHFLNEFFPSIFETSTHVIDRILEAINGIRQVLGTPKFSMYLWSGLFHPSRKVRNVYWKMWISMYNEDSDALVPGYPVEIPDPLRIESDIRDLWI